MIALKDGQDLTKGGAVVLNQDGFMTDIIEKGGAADPSQRLLQCGHLPTFPVIFKYTATLEKSPRGEYEFTDALKALVKAGSRLRGVTLPDEWADVRDPSVLAKLNELAKEPSGNNLDHLACPLVDGRGAVRRLQTAEGMRPPRALPPAKSCATLSRLFPLGSYPPPAVMGLSYSRVMKKSD